MGPIHRAVIRDKPPVFGPGVLARPLNRLVLGVAGVALAVQIGALVQVWSGQGTQVALFDHFSFALVAFLWLALGAFALLQRGRRHTGRAFLLSAATGSTFLALGTLYRVSVLDAALYTAGLLFFPAFLLSCTRAFVRSRPWRRSEALLYLPPAILFFPAAQDISHGQVHAAWKASLVLVAVYLLAAIVQAFWDLRSARTPEDAAQMRALLFGLTSGTFPGIFAFVAPIVVTGSLTVTTTWLPAMIMLFLLAISYAVLLFEFSEADLIVRRGVVYGVLTLVIIVAYGVLGVILTVSRVSVTNPGGGLSFVVVTLLVGAAFTSVRRSARRLVDWLLYGRRVDRWELLEALTARLSRVMQPDELGEVLVCELTEALNLRGAFLLRREENGSYTVRNRAGGALRAGRDAVPPGQVLSHETVQGALGEGEEAVLLVHVKPLTASQYSPVPERYRALDEMRAALSIPLVTRSGLEAVLCLQPKLAHDAFDADDVELLAPVVRQATAAIDNALLFARLEEKVEELRHAYVRIAREQEAERARLARELHDGTAQELAGLITLATVAERQMDGGDTPARSTLDRLRRQAEDAYQGVRRASHGLRPLMLDDFGLSPTLRRFIDQFQESTGIVVDYHPDGVEGLPDDVELALFRIAQECMENVRKHSGATHARLTLERQAGVITLTVSDTGHGIETNRASGIGLAGMRERIEAVGGSLLVERGPHGGVQVAARVPVAAS